MNSTAKRRRILQELVEMFCLTTADFYRVFGVSGDPSGESKVRKLLHRLSTLGFVLRAPLITEDLFAGRTVNAQNIYWLSSRGLMKAKELGLDPKGMGLANDEKSRMTLVHDYEITRFHLQLNAALGELVWWRQRDLRHHFRVGADEYGVNPDALFFAGRHYFFLEVERSKQGHYRNGESQLMKKCRSYLAYASGDRQPCKEKWPRMEGFVVLFLVKTAERRENLLKQLRGNYAHPIFWVKAIDDGDVVAGWKSPAGREHKLVESLPYQTRAESEDFAAFDKET